MSHPAPHIRDTRCKPDLRSCRKLDHLRRLSRIERNSVASAPLSTLISARPGNSIWIEPDVDGCSCGAGFRITVSHAADTVTGSKAVVPETGSTNSPRSKARRQPNTWFAFTPFARATCATLVPGWNVNSTMRRFSDVACRLRGRLSRTTPTESTMAHGRPTLDYAPEGKTTRLR